MYKQKLNISVIVGFKIRNGPRPRYTIPPQNLFKIQLNLSTTYTVLHVSYEIFVKHIPYIMVKAKYIITTSEDLSAHILKERVHKFDNIIYGGVK